MLFNLNAPTEGKDEQTMAPAFLPTSGASSIYLDGIAANGTADISIQLNAKADLLQKPYSIDMGMKYEDANAAQIEAASSISIPVKQDARFEFSDFDISPETIAVGEEGNVSCSLYNLGRIKLYNVKATFEGAGIKKEEVFVGNVESGATASIDAMLEGKKATKGPAKVTMTLSYEDEAGSLYNHQGSSAGSDGDERGRCRDDGYSGRRSRQSPCSADRSRCSHHCGDCRGSRHYQEKEEKADVK